MTSTEITACVPTPPQCASPPWDPSMGPMGPPPPLCLYDPPTGPDPYEEDRQKARQEAREGKPCPTNQHGCHYFKRSEWVFCPMCEWKNGRREASDLVAWGGTVEQQHAEVASGETIRVTRMDLDVLFKERRTFLGLLNTWDWDAMNKGGFTVLSRTQVHNLLMEYGAPMRCLTDEVWADMKARWPNSG